MPTTTDIRSPREILAAITSTAELPVPAIIHFITDKAILGLCFTADLAAGQAWSHHLGGRTDIRTSYDGNRRYLDEGLITWHGWTVQINTSEPI